MGNLNLRKGNFMSGIVSYAFLVVSALVNLIFLFQDVRHSRGNVFSTAKIFMTDSEYIPIICLAFLVLFGILLVSSAVSLVMNFTGKRALVWPALVALFCTIVALMLNSSYSAVSSNVLLVIGLVVNILWLVFDFFMWLADGGKKPSKSDFSPLKRRLLVISGLCAILSFSYFYYPLCSYSSKDAEGIVAPMGVFSTDGFSTISLIYLALVTALAVAILKCIGNAFKCLTKSDSEFVKATSLIATLTMLASAVYFVSGVTICSLFNSPEEEYTTTVYIPLIISFVLYFIYSFSTRSFGGAAIKTDGEKAAFRTRLEFLIYALAAAGLGFAQIFSDIIQVVFDDASLLAMEDVRLNGYEIFMTYNSLDSGFQLVAFVLFAAVCIIASLIAASVVCFIRSSKLFYKVTLSSLISTGVISLVIGLFGKYYEIVQRINEDAMSNIIGIEFDSVNPGLAFTVVSPSFYWFLAIAAVLLITIARRPYSKGTVGETPILQSGAASTIKGDAAVIAPTGVTSMPQSNVIGASVLADPCPAFSEIDSSIPKFEQSLEERRRHLFSAPTLESLAEFVVAYARDSRLHLSYTVEDIATFIAGLGATRLTILQGMSGTGKTSLPKIFSEAVFGNCEIIEVESSWRDKNELLGFYNEFSKTYTPKKFTQSLYKAALNKDIITFIVLDEMNLSRIEYYFSDFLSLMENEEHLRAIKLLNIPLYKNIDGEVGEYTALENGHTVKIPSNIWFIGTANRDESTFEISDKVYDRAHTMNFNKRASKPVYYGAPLDQRYLSAPAFLKLLDNAKEKVKFHIDSYPLIKQVEQLLAPYNISFGNRIANQIEDFVSIYASCFPQPESVIFDAVEKILLSKVISKLELKSIENKVLLAGEFEKLNMLRAAEFILKLNED